MDFVSLKKIFLSILSGGGGGRALVIIYLKDKRKKIKSSPKIEHRREKNI
jgi:hypothetical protein